MARLIMIIMAPAQPRINHAIIQLRSAWGPWRLGLGEAPVKHTTYIFTRHLRTSISRYIE